jgi:CBS domain-containing protein
MKARDIMTKAVMTVSPDTPIRDVALLMTEKRISGVPVVDKTGKVIGIVSQSDLLHRQELGTETRHKWWLRVFSDPDRMAIDFSKSHGIKVGDIMTRQIVSVSDDADIAVVAAVLDRGNVKRVPVMRDGAMVGLISRSDLVKAFCQTPTPDGTTAVDNATLQRVLSDKMKAQPWLSTGYLNTIVNDGTVELWGHIESPAQHRALRVLVEETSGVQKVEDHVVVGRMPVALT